MTIENSENDANVMEIPPNFFICLDDNRVKLFRRGIPGIVKKPLDDFHSMEFNWFANLTDIRLSRIFHIPIGDKL